MRLKLGFIALTDCAPLVVASELGLFEDEGLDVTLSREASWANIRDKVAAGALDGAHMLAPMALTAPVIAPLSLNANGSSITLSKALAEQVRGLDDDEPSPRTAHALRRAIDRRVELGERPLTFAVVFPFSIHAYLLRYWLADAGIDPDHDVRLTVVPPPRMAARMLAGDVDGFCAGAPWGAVIEAAGAGEIWVQGSRLWRGAPDKVLGLAAAFAAREPNSVQPLLRALIRAAVWADEPANRETLAEILSRPAYVDAPVAALRRALIPPEPFALHFHAEDAGYPRRSHALWLLGQIRRWGQIDETVDVQQTAGRVYRPDLYLQAAEAVGAATRGRLLDTEPLTPLFDGRAFDPARLDDYLESLPLGRRPAPGR
ncbi:MAG TPA: CmpA/NrtA family ABC transporter substrate-binding protein [Caulobacteraceae bacterium]|jgi:NitT/TauT family transport system ATP-binding protein/nitrate/nitrite transport system substrate-binding protein